MTANALLLFAIGYLLGSIPFGLLLTRLGGKGDVRRIGSGNIGATNVLRTGNKALAAGTLLLDIAKGALAVWLAQRFFADVPNADQAAAAGAVVGHLYPVWLKFRGGKGVATLLGVLLVLWPIGGIIYAVMWLAMLLVARISSVAGGVEASPEYRTPAGGHRAEGRAAGVIEGLIDRIRLVRSSGIGPVTFYQLIARFGSPAAALAAIPDLARLGGGKAPPLVSSAEAEQEAARVEKLGARYLALGHALYPPVLAEMDDAPPLLIARGDL
jgi:glycerol-3-phosphate acyltransferase PlsY